MLVYAEGESQVNWCSLPSLASLGVSLLAREADVELCLCCPAGHGAGRAWGTLASCLETGEELTLEQPRVVPRVLGLFCHQQALLRILQCKAAPNEVCLFSGCVSAITCVFLLPVSASPYVYIIL